ncbi:hypothetical protein XENOCAPTIV_027258, partial [Xenoophorus captivus]
KEVNPFSPISGSQFIFDTPSSPVQKSKPCTSNLQSACRLSLTTHMLCSQEMALPQGVEVISINPSAGHLSASCSLPSGRVPYLLATSCSDEKVRFWMCNVSKREPSSVDSLVYQWEEWPLLVKETLPNSSVVSVPGQPIKVSCCHSGRIAVAYRQTTNPPLNSTPHLSTHRLLPSPPALASSPFSSKTHLTQTLHPCQSLPLSPNPANTKEPAVHISTFQCESTGGSQWILEQTIVLEGTDPTTFCAASDGPPGHANIPNNTDFSAPNGNCPGYANRSLVHLDWVSQEDGSHILTVGIGTKIYLYGRLSGKPPDLGLFSETNRDQSLSRLVLLRSVNLLSSVEGSLPIPVSLSWVRDGILVVGMDCEMHVYSQWQPPVAPKPSVTVVQDTDISSSVSSILSAVRQCQEDVFTTGASNISLTLPKRSLTRSMMSLAQKLRGKKTLYDLPVEMEDSGLFEAAHQLFPTLPQYHPVQLLELMDLGKVHRAKAILSHLVKCIAGEIVILKDNAAHPEKRVHSRTISVGGSTARDEKIFNKSESSSPDYTEISSVPPLPLYALLAADEDTAHREKGGSLSGDSGHGSSQTDAYDELFHAHNTPDLDPLNNEQEETGNKVLSSHLLHSSLPGLTRMEQMSLMALADTIATTSTDLKDNQDKSKGLSTCQYAWAFHSEAEEELLNMLPALQKGETTWAELRAMGVGWWLRSTNKLRRCIEKVAKASFQRNNDPLDAAIFYLAMKKKAVVWGLYRSQKNTKMTEFFHNNFSEDRWRKAALKNAFSLLGKQRFQHSAAFFLLAGSSAMSACNPEVFNFYIYLRTHPLLLRRHFSSSDKAKVALTTEVRRADSISLDERRLFFTTAYAHLHAGCPMLALDVLSKMPKVHKHSKVSHQGAKGIPHELSVGSRNGQASEPDWSPPGLNGYQSDGNSNSRSDSVLSFDWSQPSMTLPDEPLELRWDIDKDEEDEDEENNQERAKKADNSVFQDRQDSMLTIAETMKSEESEDSDDFIAPSEDIFLAHLKFTACLKIMSNELRTLSTGYELDGGKLRYQLCQWLEREVQTHTSYSSSDFIPFFIKMLLEYSSALCN